MQFNSLTIIASALIAISAIGLWINNAQEPVSAKKAFADLRPTKGNKAMGRVTFAVVENGVKIIADIERLGPGKHGLHIHEYGDCDSPDASSAGEHYNPTDSAHGGPESVQRHVGDLGNIVANESGKAHYEWVDSKISLEGKDSILGKSIIVHAKEDDFKTQPSGNSGARIACGIIEPELEE